MILIVGGSGSGKSAYAEQKASEVAGAKKLYYCATMVVDGEEGLLRAERHRKQRQGKGFCTIERGRDIAGLAAEVSGGVVLLECLSNLVANEMFVEDTIYAPFDVAQKVYREIRCLEGCTAELVIVTNNVFEDGICYDRVTLQYLEALAAVNRMLAKEADTVTEIVAGIPLTVK